MFFCEIGVLCGLAPLPQKSGSKMLSDLRLGDHVRLKKPHPCGGNEWQVVRLGADIGLECLTCGRRMLLTRRELARRLKAILPRAEAKEAE